MWERLSLLPMLVVMTLAVSGREQETTSPADAKPAIGRVLDQFHDAASKADGTRYFSYLAPEAVFLGTDGTERWTKEEFRAYAEPYFSKGKGWTFVPRDRHVE